MSTKKTLLAVVAMAIATYAFAPTAMAAEFYDVENNEGIAVGTQLHFEGTAEFNTLGTGIHCEEVTAKVEMSSHSTGEVIAFNPTIGTCEGFGFIYEGCNVEHSTTTLLEPHVRATPADFDVTGFTEIFQEHNAACAVPTTVLEFEEEITVRLLGTEGQTVGAEEPFAGIEFETEGRATNAYGTFAIAANAELYLTPEQQCTYALRE